MFIWTIGDAVNVAALLLVALGWLVSSGRRWLKQKRCKHDSYYENRASEAICKKCRLNLGFIGRVREKSAAAHKEGA